MGWSTGQFDLQTVPTYSGQSHAFEQDVLARGGVREQIRYFPNWIEREYEALALGEKPEPWSGPLPKGFRIVYAGKSVQLRTFRP